MTAPTPPAAPAGQPTTPPNAGEPPKVTPKPEPPKAGEPPKDKPEPLGEKGLKALQEERDARKELENRLKALEPLQKIAEALGQGDANKGKTEIEQITERLAKHEEELTGERMARWRAEVANEKGLTVQQAARLQGNTREELTADADALKALFPSTPQAPGTPKPDPTQGSQGGAGADIDALILEAQKKGDVREAIRLKNAKKLASKK